jgi:ankyrin repeat protein
MMKAQTMIPLVACPSYLALHEYLQKKEWRQAILLLQSKRSVEEKLQVNFQAQERGRCGDLPLHVVVRSCATGNVSNKSRIALLELIQVLIDVYPQAVLEPNNDGYLPLHVACREDTPDSDIIDMLLSAIPHSLGGLDCGTRKTCRLPLHEACSRNTQVTSIERMVARYPDAAEFAGADGNMPLHSACAQTSLNQQCSCIDVLIAACPQALQVEDAKGNFPLHLACKGGADPSVIRLLVQSDPEVANLQDSKGDLPLHIACRHHASSYDLVQTLLDAYPESVEERGNFGGLPLHEACSNSSLSMHVLRALTAAYPKGLQVNAGGSGGVNLPLHFACDSKAPFERNILKLLNAPIQMGFYRSI